MISVPCARDREISYYRRPNKNVPVKRQRYEFQKDWNQIVKIMETAKQQQNGWQCELSDPECAHAGT